MCVPLCLSGVCECLCVSMSVCVRVSLSASVWVCASPAWLSPGTVNPSTPHDFVNSDS